MSLLKVLGHPKPPADKTLVSATLIATLTDEYADGTDRYPRVHAAEWDETNARWKPLGAADGTYWYLPGGEFGQAYPPDTRFHETQVYDAEGTDTQVRTWRMAVIGASGEWNYPDPPVDSNYVSVGPVARTGFNVVEYGVKVNDPEAAAANSDALDALYTRIVDGGKGGGFDFPEGTVYVERPLTITDSNVTLRGKGRQSKIVTPDTLGEGDIPYPAVYFKGVGQTTRLTTTDLLKGARSVSLSSTVGLEVDDWLLFADLNSSGSGFNCLWHAQIQAIDGPTVTLYSFSPVDFTVANATSARPLDMLEGSGVYDMVIEVGADADGVTHVPAINRCNLVYFEYCNRPECYNVEALRAGSFDNTFVANPIATVLCNEPQVAGCCSTGPGAFGSAIWCQYSTGADIRDNTSRNCGFGIVCQRAPRCNVHDNYIYGREEHFLGRGVKLEYGSVQGKIDGNLIFDCPFFAIYSHQSADVQITNNMCFNNGGPEIGTGNHAIQVAGGDLCFNNAVHNNFIYNAGGYGIAIGNDITPTTELWCSVSGNHLNKTTHGIFLGASRNFVHGNFVRDFAPGGNGTTCYIGTKYNVIDGNYYNNGGSGKAINTSLSDGFHTIGHNFRNGEIYDLHPDDIVYDPTVNYGDPINLRQAYGLNPDGVTDNYSRLQSALTAASAGTAFYLPAGKYRVSGNLTWKAGVALYGAGMGKTEILPDDIAGNFISYGQGAAGNVLLTADATPGQTTVTVADASFWVTTDPSNDNFVLIQDDLTNSSANGALLVRVISVSGNVLTLENPIPENWTFATAQNAKAFYYTIQPAAGIEFHDLTIRTNTLSIPANRNILVSMTQTFGMIFHNVELYGAKDYCFSGGTLSTFRFDNLLASNVKTPTGTAISIDKGCVGSITTQQQARLKNGMIFLRSAYVALDRVFLGGEAAGQNGWGVFFGIGCTCCSLTNSRIVGMGLNAVVLQDCGDCRIDGLEVFNCGFGASATKDKHAVLVEGTHTGYSHRNRVANVNVDMCAGAAVGIVANGQPATEVTAHRVEGIDADNTTLGGILVQTSGNFVTGCDLKSYGSGQTGLKGDASTTGNAFTNNRFKNSGSGKAIDTSGSGGSNEIYVVMGGETSSYHGTDTHP